MIELFHMYINKFKVSILLIELHFREKEPFIKGNSHENSSSDENRMNST